LRVTLICHGETSQQTSDSEHRDNGLPLTPIGRRQARALAAEIAALAERGAGIAELQTSPKQGAIETAAEIARVLGVVEASVNEDLAAPSLQSLAGDAGIDALSAFQERAWSLVDTLKEKHDPAATVVLVTDELTVRAVVCRALSMPLTEMKRFFLEPASLTMIEFRGPRTLLACLNETCHLDLLESSP
jgi:ribonuclease H / adenosylcobalamin/alpha-ribazole phosphatase